MSIEQKSRHLMERVDLERPELDAVRRAARPAEAFAQYLAKRNAGRFRFEHEQKATVLDFLRASYGRWRDLDLSRAEGLATLPIDAARQPRALAGIAALGKAWWATGDPKYGTAFERFYVETDTGDMFNWDAFNGTQGAVELDAWFLMQDCPGFSTNGRIAFMDHLIAITEFAWDDATSQWNEIALGPEGHNWWLHGVHVLPFIGILFPEFKRSTFFHDTGWSIVEEHMRAHYRADGGARETTPGYQHGSLLDLWDFMQLSQRNGNVLSDGFIERLMTATRFMLSLATPSGGTPSFGDSAHEPGGLTTLAAVAAALAGDPECKWYSEQWRGLRQPNRKEAVGQIPERAFWRVGLEGARSYANTPARSPRGRSVLLGPTGYVAMRSSENPGAAYLAMAAAERGPIVTSHGHNDIFSMEVHAGGIRFIGEMGCAPYGTSPGRQYDESTEAHSCLTVKGEELVPIVSEWRWVHQLRPVITRWINTPAHDFVQGTHEGFYRWPDHQVLHARKIFFRKPRHETETGYWVIMDWVESDREHEYAVYFHGCVPGVEAGAQVVLGDPKGLHMHVVPPEGDPVRLTRVDNAGYQAYVREKNLDPAQYPCFVYEQTAASHCFVWALLPVQKGGKVAKLKRVPVLQNGEPAGSADATAIELRWDDYAEILCVSHKPYDTHLEYAGRRAWGVLACNVYGLDRVHTAVDGVCGS